MRIGCGNWSTPPNAVCNIFRSAYQRADVGVVNRSFIRTATKPLARWGEVRVSVEVLVIEDETLS